MIDLILTTSGLAIPTDVMDAAQWEALI